MSMTFFIEEILEDEAIKDILLNDHDNLSSLARKISQDIIKNGTMPTLEAGILPIFVLADLAEFALEKNNKKEIPRDITVETLKDVNIWINNYTSQFGRPGLAEFHWLFNHYTGDLFKLGRLQYRIEKSLDGIPHGEYAIETHIPQGEPLDIEQCLESFGAAKEFFKKYFSETKAEYFMCDSWLLNRNLDKILAPESNIVNFMRLWTPIPFPADDSKQAIERIFGFGFSVDQIETAPENTSLQRKFKDFLLSGGELNITAGYRKI